MLICQLIHRVLIWWFFHPSLPRLVAYYYQKNIRLYAHNTIKIRKTILIDSAWFILQEYKKLRLYTIFFVSEANLNISATNVTFFSLYLLTELESCSLLSDFSSYAFRFCKLFHSSNSLFIFPAYCLTAHCKLWNILCNAVHLYIRYLTNFMISDFMTFIQT